MTESIKKYLEVLDDDECVVVKVLDKDTGESVFDFNEGYYRKQAQYPLEVVELFVDYVENQLEIEIFHISGNQIMTCEGLFVVTEKRHLNTSEFKYDSPEL